MYIYSQSDWQQSLPMLIPDHNRSVKDPVQIPKRFECPDPKISQIVRSLTK